ncbi:MAG TPA: sigma-70 family RNA polymerase sigma factor [Thermoanaerobaculia bacterium]
MSEEASELLTANRELIRKAVDFVCRRYRFDIDDAEDFASVVNLRLIEHDYAILRAYEQRSSFATYLSIVIQRMALDYRNHVWGKWRASAAARRLGDVAVDLEQLLHRDGKTFDDAFTILAKKHDGVTRESLLALAAQLPERAPRHRDVDLEEAEPYAIAGPVAVEEKVRDDERRAAAVQLRRLLAAAFEKMPDDDRLLLQLRFEQGLTVAQMARALGRDQKLLYRQLERRMKEIRAELQRSGIAAADVADLIGRDEIFFSFDFGKHAPRPSMVSDEKVATAWEESS